MNNFTIIFRAQVASDVIRTAEECWTDGNGAYQLAHGTDKDGNEITLSNNGFSAWPNYVVTVENPEIKAFKLLQTKLNKYARQWQIADKLFSEVPSRKNSVILYLASSRTKDLSQKYETMKRELRIY